MALFENTKHLMATLMRFFQAKEKNSKTVYLWSLGG
jgi:hypothetical protein